MRIPLSPQAHTCPLSTTPDLLSRGCLCSHPLPSALVSLSLSSPLSSLSRSLDIASLSRPLDITSLSHHLVTSSLLYLIVSFPIAPLTPRPLPLLYNASPSGPYAYSAPRLLTAHTHVPSHIPSMPLVLPRARGSFTVPSTFLPSISHRVWECGFVTRALARVHAERRRCGGGCFGVRRK